MNDRDSVLLDVLLREKETQRQNLRVLDSSLHQLAFAYIAAFALCIPALINFSVSGTLSSLDAIVHYVSFFVCTNMYIGGVYALALIRSRNLHLAHIAHLSERINELLVSNFGKHSRVLFQQSREISSFYWGSNDGRSWVLIYAALLFPVMIMVVFTEWKAYIANNYPICILTIAEPITICALYITVFRSSGLKHARDLIDSDYYKWLINLDKR